MILRKLLKYRADMLRGRDSLEDGGHFSGYLASLKLTGTRLFEKAEVMSGCYAVFHKQLGDLVLLEPLCLSFVIITVLRWGA